MFPKNMEEMMKLPVLQNPCGRSTGRKYEIKKERGGQYYAYFPDDESKFWLNSDTRKEAVEEAAEYDDEGLFK